MYLFIAQEFDPFRTDGPVSVWNRARIELQPNQVPLWLSFLPSGPADGPFQQASPPAEAIVFGAVFDSGCGHTLSVARRHLGINKEDISRYCDLKRPLKARSVHGATAKIDRLLGHLWIHSNLHPNDEKGRAVLKVTLKTEGIACYGALGDGNGDASSNVEKAGPRIPVLGSLTLALAKINVFLKYSGYGNPKQAACAYFYAPGERRPGIA